MIRNVKSERRQYPRINHEVPLNVAANGYQFSTATENISCVGTYCRINKYIPPFTRVMVRLSLPMRSEVAKKYDFECKGVVVRTEDSSTGEFNIAIFFNQIKEAQRKKISEYLSQFC
jgi:hypothetical protein